jgi:hypothetical protein
MSGECSISSMKKIKAITVVLAALLSGCASFRVGDIRVGDTPARRIAKETSLPGKNVDGQCLPFAVALHARFQAAGIPSKVISFNYETLPAAREIFGELRAIAPVNERGGITGVHAVVAYEDQGRTYVMDNQSWQPKWIHDASAIGIAQQFGGMDTLVAKARVVDYTRSSNAATEQTHAAHLFRARSPALRPQLAEQSHSPLRREASRPIPGADSSL